jgi:Holliday junction resolvasome RuvABC ATP-dependent DNA helicase subunit
METKIFSDSDKAMLSIKMAVAAVDNTSKLLKKYGRITPKLPITLPHTLFYGPGGTGKTKRVEEAVKLMGCSEEAGTFIRVSPDCLKKNGIEGFIDILNKNLSWEGYLCNHGKTSHCNCPSHNHKIVDTESPRAPVKQIAVFLDEIHVVPADIQEKLGLILLDFKYQTVTPLGLKTYYFPKFTLFAATTLPGDLIKPLRTRFGNKFSVSYYTDTEMVSIASVMAKQRGWNVDAESLELLAKASQGIARECENHLTGLFNCWIYLMSTGQEVNKHVITKEVTLQYLSIKQFTEDGLSFDQVKILKYLASFAKDGKVKGVGVNRVCGALGLDAQRFSDELEPRLSAKNFISSGGRGREITNEGMQYLEVTLTKYPELSE